MHCSVIAVVLAAVVLCVCVSQLQGMSVPFFDTDDQAVESTTKESYVQVKIGSFNIQVFGSKKSSKKAVMKMLVKIILRYDIILIQEIRSKTDKAINDLLAAVNREATPPGVYAMALSKRLGRSNSKEQYAYFYRTDKVQKVDSYVYDDGAVGSKMDKFQREPYIIKFKAPYSYIKEFALAAIHTMPSRAVHEIDNLVDVYNDIVRRFKIPDVIIMGDFNADCTYVTKSKWKRIRLATDRRFYWLFHDTADSTVSNTDCAYDRMVVAGNVMKKAIVPGSAKVFNYAKAYNLNQKEAKSISDHWVIEVKLKDISYLEEEKYITEPETLTIEDSRLTGLPKSHLVKLKSKLRNPLLKRGFQLSVYYTRGKRGFHDIVIEKDVETIEAAVSVTREFNEAFPTLVSSAQIAASYRRIKEFINVLKRSCEGKPTGNVYQDLPITSCLGKGVKVHKAKLVCHLPTSRCKVVFVFV